VFFAGLHSVFGRADDANLRYHERLAVKGLSNNDG
jgi:hypothetical protein